MPPCTYSNPKREKSCIPFLSFAKTLAAYEINNIAATRCQHSVITPAHQLRASGSRLLDRSFASFRSRRDLVLENFVLYDSSWPC